MINYNNIPKLLISQGQANNTFNLKPKASQGTSAEEFKSVFNKTIDNTAKRTNVSNSLKDNNDISQNSDSEIKYKSFRDLKMNQSVSSLQSSVEKLDGNNKSQKADLETEKSKNDSNKYDESMNVLAQMLGLQPSELVKLENELGLSAEDLQDTKKPLIESLEITLGSIQATNILLQNITPNKQVLEKAMTEDLFAAEKAFALVKQGVPFRKAYMEVKK